MGTEEKLSDEAFWKKKIKEHRNSFVILIVAAICAFVGVLIVLFWFIAASPLGGYGTWYFNDWSLEAVVLFMVWLCLSELLFVGIPAILVFGVGGYIWWKRLPTEERQEFKDREKKKTHRKRNYGGGGGFSFFVFIAFCIYVAVDGYYATAFGSYPAYLGGYSYFVYAWFLTIMWIFIVLGIPAAIIILIVYLTVWRKKSE